MTRGVENVKPNFNLVKDLQFLKGLSLTFYCVILFLKQVFDSLKRLKKEEEIEEEKEIENPFGIEMEDSEDEPTHNDQPTQESQSKVAEPEPPTKAKTEFSVDDHMSQLDSL